MITEYVSPARLIDAALRATAIAPMSATADWTSIYGNMPAEKPTNRLAVMSTSPITWFKDPRTMQLVQHLGAQVLVRSKKKEAGFLKAMAVIARLIRAKVDDPIAVTIDSVDYVITHCSLASGPIYIGWEEKDLADFHSVNLLFTAEPG